MRVNFQFGLCFLFVLTYLVAISFAKNLGQVTFAFFLEPIVIWLIVTFLYHGIPKELRKSSRENSYRMDGTKSTHRASCEQAAQRQVQSNLYAVIISVMLSGTWLFLLFSDILLSDPLKLPNAWLIMAEIVLAWFFASCYVVRYAYFAILREFHVGIKSRSDEYLTTDIARMQSLINVEAKQGD